MKKIVDTINEDIVEPVGPPLKLRLCNIEFLDDDSSPSVRACIAEDDAKREVAFTYITSHVDHAEHPGRFIFLASLESGSESRFTELVLLALLQDRGIILDGRLVNAPQVEQFFLPVEQWRSLGDILEVMREKAETSRTHRNEVSDEQ